MSTNNKEKLREQPSEGSVPANRTDAPRRATLHALKRALFVVGLKKILGWTFDELSGVSKEGSVNISDCQDEGHVEIEGREEIFEGDDE